MELSPIPGVDVLRLLALVFCNVDRVQDGSLKFVEKFFFSDLFHPSGESTRNLEHRALILSKICDWLRGESANSYEFVRALFFRLFFFAGLSPLLLLLPRSLLSHTHSSRSFFHGKEMLQLVVLTRIFFYNYYSQLTGCTVSFTTGFVTLECWTIQDG